MGPMADVNWARMQSLDIQSFNRSELAVAVAAIGARHGCAALGVCGAMRFLVRASPPQ